MLVNEAHWVETFENMITFRRWLRSEYGLPLTAEIKGAQLAKGTGPWRKLQLSPTTRHEIYRWAMVFQDQRAQDLKTFAVVVRKDKCEATRDVRAVGWQYAFERVNTFTRKQGSPRHASTRLGQYHWVRALARKMRRFAPVPSAYGTGSLRRPLAETLVDDPVERDSAQSYMIQLADLNAYAAYRNRVPDPRFPKDTWSHLKSAILEDANKIEAQRDRDATPGIKDAP